MFFSVSLILHDNVTKCQQNQISDPVGIQVQEFLKDSIML